VACGDGAEDLTPFPGVEVEIRAGTIWVRSPYLALGYSRPGGPMVVGPDGFATVGDAGELRGARLVVTGRSDVVVTGGATVLLHEVEGVLQDAVGSGVAVVGVPHAYLGSVVACALEDPGDVPPAREVSRSRLSAAQRPRLWCHVPQLPLTAAGKTDREALRRVVVDARAGRGPGELLVPTARR
jgi:acyl-CoA synthetase (AMP-forming)/AMP-acid ligase II